ncbi:peptide deformylase [Chitinivorax sp. B]|uniref:peptide deformylase n=1 Tax=Chitinivorax sp. B TaxID=2502235 RepID=UPI0010F50F11|nr:peptide deformylase [Chitinivorax sp. B]
MAILNILHYPDERLHTVAQPVTDFGPDLQKLIDDMAETMYAAPGVGLAATQVDAHKQLFIADISEEQNTLMVFINPRITKMNGECELEEGCLSVPGIYDKVANRAKTVTVEALDRHGKPYSLDADGLLALCIQHELDHLKGKVFVEYLSRLKQDRIMTKLKKNRRKSM